MARRLAILTDLHANREAVEAVLAHASGQSVDQYALLGDFVGYGADPAWVVDRVRALVEAGAWAVRGNHDTAVVSAQVETMRLEARTVIGWTREHLDADQMAFLGQLPLTQQVEDVLFVHANAYAPDQWDYVDGRLEATRSMQATGQRVTFCGHVHEPRLYHLSSVGKASDFKPASAMPIPLLETRRWLAIPGAVGQPRDGVPAACYATYDLEAATLTYWRVPYDHESAAAKVRVAGLPQSLAHRLEDGQ